MPTITREALYALVWEQPVRSVAASLSISDVGLKKQCAAAGIPVPERGYWTKLKAGKPVVRVRLAPRAPGKAEVLQFGGIRSYGSYQASDLSEPVPDPPVFEESLEDLRERLSKQVGTVRGVRDLKSPSSAVRKLLEADQKRRAQFAASPYDWNRPLFDSPFEQRRLRLLDALCQAMPRHGAKLELSGGEARNLRFKIGDQWIDAELDHPNAKPDRWGRHTVKPGPVGPLKLELKLAVAAGAPRAIWIDGDCTKLEACLSEIVAQPITCATGGQRCIYCYARPSHAWMGLSPGLDFESRLFFKPEGPRLL